MQFLRFAIIFILLVIEAVAGPLWKHQVDSVKHDNLSKRKHVPASHVRHEWQEPRNSRGWTRGKRAHPQGKVPMRIGLNQKNVEKGRAALMKM